MNLCMNNWDPLQGLIDAKVLNGRNYTTIPRKPTLLVFLGYLYLACWWFSVYHCQICLLTTQMNTSRTRFFYVKHWTKTHVQSLESYTQCSMSHQYKARKVVLQSLDDVLHHLQSLLQRLVGMARSSHTGGHIWSRSKIQEPWYQHTNACYHYTAKVGQDIEQSEIWQWTFSFGICTLHRTMFGTPMHFFSWRQLDFSWGPLDLS